jgi:cholesterol transport system auxiliary component
MRALTSHAAGAAFPSAWPRRAGGLFVGALLLGLAACSGSAPPTTFDLTAPAGAVRQSPGARQLVVAEPTALQALDSDRIVVRGADGTISFLPGAQWSDRLPRLMQNRLIESFENTGRAVSRAGGSVSGDAGLVWDVRFFGVDTTGPAQARVEVSVRLVDATSGRIARARVFRGAEPLGAVDGKSAATALDQVSGRVFAEIVRWSAGPVSAPAPVPAAPAAPPPDGRAEAPAEKPAGTL